MGIIRNVKKALTWLRPGRKARALFAGRPWKRAPKHLRSIAIPTRKNGLIGPAKPLRMTRPSSYQGLLIPAAPTPDPSTVQTVTIKPSPPIAHPSYVNPRISLQTAIDACRLWYKIRVTANGKETTAAPGGTFRSFQLLGVPMAKPAHTAKAYLKGVRVGVTFSIPLGEQPDFDFDPHTGRATHNTLGQFRNNESLTPDQKLALAREEDDFVIGEALRLRCVGVRFQLQDLGADVVKYSHGEPLDPRKPLAALIVLEPAAEGRSWYLPGVELVTFEKLREWISTTIRDRKSKLRFQ